MAADFSAFVKIRIQAVSKRYLEGQSHALADPLLMFESDRPSDRPIPPIMAFSGTHDPVLDDTHRLDAALKRRKLDYEARYYPGAFHGFHLVVWSKDAQSCWSHQLQFMSKHLSVQPESSDPVVQN